MHTLYERANALSKEVVEAALKVREHFGPGLLESIYVKSLAQALRVAGHKVEQEKSVTIEYMGAKFDEKLRIDLLVDDCLIVEGKAVETCDLKRFRVQVLSYMKLMDIPLGLVINFSDDHFARHGIGRVILKDADREEVTLRTSTRSSGWRG